MFELRVLVANSPRMYRESLALSIKHHRPHVEVSVADPQEYGEELERFEPQVLVRDDDGATTEMPRGVVSWVGIIIDDHLNARIKVDGRVVSEVHDVALEELISALDRTENILATEGLATEGLATEG